MRAASIAVVSRVAKQGTSFDDAETKVIERMRAANPVDLHHLFMEAFNAHDLDALVGLYEPEAILIPEAGQRAIGTDAIRQALAGFLGAFARIELTTRGVVQRDNVALLYPDFTLHGIEEAGSPPTLEGHGTEVARQQSYGTWLFVIDDPFSTA